MDEWFKAIFARANRLELALVALGYAVGMVFGPSLGIVLAVVLPGVPVSPGTWAIVGAAVAWGLYSLVASIYAKVRPQNRQVPRRSPELRAHNLIRELKQDAAAYGRTLGMTADDEREYLPRWDQAERELNASALNLTGEVRRWQRSAGDLPDSVLEEAIDRSRAVQQRLLQEFGPPFDSHTERILGQTSPEDYPRRGQIGRDDNVTREIEG